MSSSDPRPGPQTVRPGVFLGPAIGVAAAGLVVSWVFGDPDTAIWLSVTACASALLTAAGWLTTKRAAQNAAHAGDHASFALRNRLAEQLFAYNRATSAMFVIDPEGTLRSANDAVRPLTGYRPEELDDRLVSVLDPVLVGDARSVTEVIRQGGRWDAEATFRHKNGDLRAVWLQLTPLPKEAGDGALVTLTNIAALKADGADDAKGHRIDGLTGLPNRLTFKERMRHAVREAEAKELLGAVVFIDINDFKTVNDAYGHDIGDGILTEAGRRLTELLHSTDTAARVDGDEFGLILRDVGSQEGLEAVLSAIRAAFSRPFAAGEAEVYLRLSIGSALFPKQSNDVSDLLKYADTAVLAAKNRSGDRHMAFTPDMMEGLKRAAELRDDLSRAIDGNELRLVYQPVLSRNGVTITGAEALLRWRHPERGELPPGLFIPIAEQSGLIHAIGNWVMAEAARQRAAWRAHVTDEFFVAVNVSAHQLANPDFVDHLKTSLADNDLDASSMQFDLTEGVFLDEMGVSQQAMTQLADMGVRFAIDDFGSGYASLPFIKRMPIHALKVDGDFIARIPDSETELAMVNAIVQISKSLGLCVVAEGIDSADHLKAAADVPFDMLQGNYFCRALEVEMFEQRYFAKPQTA